MRHLRTILICVAFSIALCPVVMSNEFFFDKPRDVDIGKFPEKCSKEEYSGRNYRGSSLACRDLVAEAKLIKSNPGVASRVGDELNLFYNGNLISHLKATGTDGCDVYNISKMIRVFDPKTSQLQTISEVVCHVGEFEKHFVMLPNGKRWNVHNVMSSPSGMLVADGTNLQGSAKLTIIDWRSRKVIGSFAPNCRVVNWNSEVQFTATCLYQLKAISFLNGGYVAFDALVKRDVNGDWNMRSVRWLNPREGEFTVSGDKEYKPTFALLWPLNFKAEASKHGEVPLEL